MTLRIDPATLPEATAGPARYQLFIDGQWTDGSAGATGERVSPGHGVAVSRYAYASAADVDRAVAAARKAFDHGPWPKLKASERAAILLRTADLIEENAEAIARLDALESGKPIRQARGEIAGSVDIWRYAASLARTLHGESYANLGEDMLGVVVRQPIGVVAIVTPWNFPFLIVSQKLPFALAAGCTVVMKPSELTSASTVLLTRLLMDAGLPDGVVNLVMGTGPEVGAPMVSHAEVDMISFTGSTRVGRWAMESAAKTLKKVSMELGGKNAQVVFPDGDIEAAVDAALFGAFFNAGECCNAGSRLLLHKSIAEDFLAAMDARRKDVVVGDPLDDGTDVGAIITPEHLAKIESAIVAATGAGAELRGGGSRLVSAAGQYLEPTIVAGVKPDMPIARDEVFGPVVSVLTFSDLPEAIALANGTDYGLSAGVWSADIDTALGFARAVRTGTVWVNTFMDGHPELPFGGFKQSGLGRELGKHAVEDYSESKTIQIHRGPRTSWWVRR